MGKLQGKRPIGRPRCRREDNIKIYIQVVGWTINWIDLVKGRDRWWAIVNAIMNLQISIKCGEFLDYLRAI